MSLVTRLSAQQVSLFVFSIVKIATGFGLYKWVSVTYGVESLAVLGQVLSLGALVTFLATGGIGRGVIHYLSRYRDDDERVSCIRRHARTVLVLSSALCAGVLFVFADPLSRYLIGGNQLDAYIRILAAFSLIIGFNNLSLAYCAVEEKQVPAMTATGAGMIAALLVTVSLGLLREVSVYFYYPVIQAVFVFVFLLLLVGKSLFPYVFVAYERSKNCRAEMYGLLRHSGVLVLSICISGFVAIYMRREIIGALGLGEAGIWEVSQKISDGYMQFFGLVLVYSALQKMSSDSKNKIRYLRETIWFFLGGLAAFLFAMFYLGETVIGILFSPDWAERSNRLTLLIIIGDLFRICFVTLQYYYLSQDKVRLFVALELTWGSVLLVLFSLYPSGTNLAQYAVAYIMAFALCLLVSLSAFKMLRAAD